MVDKKCREEEKEGGNGILFCSGMIAGEGLLGILLAIFAVLGVEQGLDISGNFYTGQAGGAVLLLITLAVVYLSAKKKEGQGE